MRRFFGALRQKVDPPSNNQPFDTSCSSGQANRTNANNTNCKSNKLNIVSKSEPSQWEVWNEDEVELHRKICNILLVEDDCTEREITQMKHINQLDTWDCGLTCIQMILLWLQADCSNISHGQDQIWMRDLVKTESIWSIDLVWVLHHALRGDDNNFCSRDNTKLYQNRHDGNADVLNLHFKSNTGTCIHSSIYAPTSFLFCSTRLGVDESYNKLGYYKDAFNSDMQRVQQLFAKALNENMPLLQVPYLSLKVLVDIVSREDCVAIVLVDNRVLLNQEAGTESNQENEEISTNTSYSGHYVILCGISYDCNNVEYAKSFFTEDSNDDTKFCMVLNNPGSWKDQEFVTAKRFEKAWRSNGTDDDIIIIKKKCYNYS